MKIFVALLALVAVAAAVDDLVYETDEVLDEAIISKFYVDHFTLSHGPQYLLPLHGKGAIDDKIIALLEGARDKFEEGFPDMDIPPLEPLSLDHFSTHVYQKAVINADVDLDNIAVAGLKQFVIDSFVFKIVGLTVTFEFSLPKLVLNSKYAINGKVASFIPFRPSGDAHAEIDSLSVRGAATLGTLDGGYLVIRAFKTDFAFDKLKISLSGILGDGLVNSLFNWVLSKISNSVVQGQKDNIAEKASGLILEVGNNLLKDVKLADLIG